MSSSLEELKDYLTLFLTFFLSTYLILNLMYKFNDNYIDPNIYIKGILVKVPFTHVQNE